MQTTREIWNGARKTIKELGPAESWIHFSVWILGLVAINIPQFELTFGVFHSGDYSLLFPSIYGAILNALIVYGTIYLVQKYLKTDQRKFIVRSLLWFSGACLLETLSDSLFYGFYYQYFDGAIFLDILIGSFLMNGIFFYLPSLVLGVMKGIHVATPTAMPKLHIKNGRESVFVSANDLLYIESDGNYCVFQTRTAKIAERKSLTQLENELPAKFVRCHKSFIVNTELIGTKSRKEIKIAGYSIPIGRKYADRIVDKY